MSRFFVLLVAVLAMPAGAQISPPIATSSDGKLYSEYRAGDLPSTPGMTWTKAESGDVQACELTETDADTITITAGSQHDGIGICYGYVEIESEDDFELRFSLEGIAGHEGNFTGGGAVVLEADHVLGEDYAAYTWCPSIGRMRFKTDVAGGSQLGQIGKEGSCIGVSGLLQYDLSDTELRGGEHDGEGYIQIGESVVKELTFPVRVGFWGTSYSAEATSTLSFDDLVNTDTLTALGAASEPPGDPEIVSDTPDYEDPVEGVTLLGGRTTVNVSNGTQLSSAISSAQCGQDIVLGSGTYSGNLTLSTSCPANNPVVVQGAANFGSVLTGTLTLNGARNIVRGMQFDGGHVRLGGTNNKVIGNRFTGWTQHAIAVVDGTLGEIAYNELYEHADWGAVTASNFQMRIAIRTAGNEGTTPPQFQEDVWVHHNYFHDFPTKPDPNRYSSGQNDAIEMCQASSRAWEATIDTGWYIEFNLIADHLQGSGLIDLKCGGAVVRYNTVRDSPAGRIDQRQATSVGSTIESNWFDNAGGSFLHGANNRVIGNRVSGGGRLAALSGQKECDDGLTTQHGRACDNLFAGNVAPLTVGLDRGPLPAIGTTIEEHTGSITFGIHSDTTNNSGSATSVNFTPAFPLATDQVGPGAISSASAAYKAARGL